MEGLINFISGLISVLISLSLLFFVIDFTMRTLAKFNQLIEIKSPISKKLSLRITLNITMIFSYLFLIPSALVLFDLISKFLKFIYRVQ